MNVDALYSKIIPPPTREARDGFSNEHILNALGEKERNEIESRLLSDLDNADHWDSLVVSTLINLKSEKALEKMTDLLNSESDFFKRIVMASAIYQLSGNTAMIEVAVSAFKSRTKKYSTLSMMNHLSKIREPEIMQLMEKLAHSKDSVVRFNANVLIERMK